MHKRDKSDCDWVYVVQRAGRMRVQMSKCDSSHSHLQSKGPFECAFAGFLGFQIAIYISAQWKKRHEQERLWVRPTEVDHRDEYACSRRMRRSRMVGEHPLTIPSVSQKTKKTNQAQHIQLHLRTAHCHCLHIHKSPAWPAACSIWCRKRPLSTSRVAPSNLPPSCNCFKRSSIRIRYEESYRAQLLPPRAEDFFFFFLWGNKKRRIERKSAFAGRPLSPHWTHFQKSVLSFPRWK